MPSGKRARQQRQQAAATVARTPPPVRSKGAGGVRPRQASPRTLAIAGGVVAIVVIAIVLGVVLTRGSSNKPPQGAFPTVGSHNWTGALTGASDVYQLFKGVPEKGLVLGSPNAPATLTEYIDLQCPVCDEFERDQLPTLVQKYVRTGQLNIKMQPWAIRGPDSNRGQAATIAASLQNRGFPFAEMLYLNQGAENTGWLSDNMVKFAAASVDGLRWSKVLSDSGSSNVTSIVNGVDGAASIAGFNATPTILLNHTGQKPHVVSVGLPDLTTLERQIQASTRG
jgi:protein-disulfide isomerase